MAMDLAMTKDLFSADEKNPQVMVIGFHPPFHGNVMGQKIYVSHMASLKSTNWRFIAGKIIYKYGNCSEAMFDRQME